MPENGTSHRLVGLQDALRVLDRAGPVSSAALAHELGLHRLEVRMMMLQAHWYGLVRATNRGEWAISQRGREALAGRAAPPSIPEQLRTARAAVSGYRWRRRWRLAYLTSGSVPVMLGVLICAAASAAVATNSVPILAPPPAQVRPHRHHHHHGTFGPHAPARGEGRELSCSSPGVASSERIWRLGPARLGGRAKFAAPCSRPAAPRNLADPPRSRAPCSRAPRPCRLDRQ